MATPPNPNPRLWSAQCIIDWLKIREQEGHPFPTDVSDFAVQMDHSALLRRLMEGKLALPDAPPLSFSNPWYDLAERGHAIPYEVFISELPGGSLGGGDSIYVNQHPWRIVTANYATEKYVVRFGNSPTLYNLWVSSIGVDEDGVARKSWKIERQ